MGTPESKEKPLVDDSHVINIINANNKLVQHASESAKNSTQMANALTMLAYIAVLVIGALFVYKLYKVVTKFERMRTTIDNSNKKPDTVPHVI